MANKFPLWLTGGIIAVIIGIVYVALKYIISAIFTLAAIFAVGALIGFLIERLKK